jgi:hypothetical protein
MNRIQQPFLIFFFSIIWSVGVFAQQLPKKQPTLLITDSAYIIEEEKLAPRQKPKVLHAEPLYIDLIRDLGAHKGEREWNVAAGLQDKLDFDAYEALVEYEWAIKDRLGLEIELPFTFYSGNRGQKPASQLESLKLAAQYTFLVSPKANTSLAIGYLHELQTPAFKEFGQVSLLQGHLSTPFLVAAKRWGTYLHTLLYTGPMFEYSRASRQWQAGGQYHFNLHYMMPGTRHFVGVETNVYSGNVKSAGVTLRPQMRLEISEQFLIGVVTGIPLSRGQERLSAFCRLIYEPH